MSRGKVATSSLEQLLQGGEYAPPRAGLGARCRGALARVVALGVVGGLIWIPASVGAASGVQKLGGVWNSIPHQLGLAAPLPQRTLLVDERGHTFAQLYTQDRVDIPLSRVSPAVVSALLSTEDTAFYTDQGINIKGTVRSAVHDLSGAGGVQGGSGITEQVVKNLLVLHSAAQSGSRSLGLKVQEIRDSYLLDKRVSKNKILDEYLNIVYFGGGAYGIEAASERFFSLPASALTVPQAALLVGMVQNPSGYDPLLHPGAAAQRRGLVLLRMYRNHKLTREQERAYAALPLGIHPALPPNGCGESTYPFYCEHVVNELLTNKAFGTTMAARVAAFKLGGLVIHTALNPRAMSDATSASTAALAPTNRVADSVVVIKPGTGHIVALTQNRTWGTSAALGQTELVYADQPSFQPGSSFKAITLTTALSQGIPLSIKMSAPSPYTPPNMDAPPGGFHNDGRISYGPNTNVYEATGASINTWYVKLIGKTGVLPVANMAANLGMTSLPRSGPTAITTRTASLTLGAFETSPIQMATVYATLAGGGVECTPTAITMVTPLGGNTQLPAPATNCHQAVLPGIAAQVTHALLAPLGKGGTAAGEGLLGRPAAGKTGTTNNSGALWFVGYTPQYVTAVWSGDPRGASAHPLTDVTAFGQFFPTTFGATISAPIWHQVMAALEQGLPVEQFPSIDAAASTLVSLSLPDVRGLGVRQAARVLRGEGYLPILAPAPSSGGNQLPPNVVVSQLPAPGSVGRYRERVTLTLSPLSTMGGTQ